VSNAPSKQPKLEKMGSNLMDELPDGAKAFLFMVVSDSLPLQEMWRSGDMEKGTGGDGKRVLGICCKRQRSVLIHDAEKDTQMRGIKFRSFLSALCVPIFDQDKSLLGAFLMIAEKPEVFTNEHKFALERAARDYGPTLAGMRRVTQTEEEKEETGERFKLLFSPVVLGFTACALMLLGIWLLSPPAKEAPQTTATAQPREITHEVPDVAARFLTNLQEGQFEQAWLLLSPPLRKRWASADFMRAWANWVAEGENSEILKQRQISKLQRHNNQTQITLLESPVSGDREHWNWELQEIDGEWGISKVSGPVKSP